MIEHPLRHADLDLDELRRRMSARVGRELGMVTRPPTATGEPGVLLFEDAQSAERIPTDPRDVTSVIDQMVAERAQRQRRGAAARRAEVVAQAKPPELPHTAAADLASFDAAPDDATRWAAVRTVLARAAEEEDKYRAQMLAEYGDRLTHLQECPVCSQLLADEDPTLDGTPT